MIPNVAKAGMVRLGASLLTLALCAVPALAGDRALIDFIGYSPDGSHFAFAEMGVQDGSGFPYANVYVLDVANDSFVAGPFRVRMEEEGATIADARQQALAAAKGTLAKLETQFPVDLWALSGDGIEGIVHSLDFGVPGYSAPKTVQNGITVKLETFEAPSAEPCGDYTDRPVLGFALSFTGETWETVHRDERIPKSRGCPLDYSIFAVVAPMDAQELGQAVAIVSVYSLGFEGEDRRFIAVPLAIQ